MTEYLVNFTDSRKQPIRINEETVNNNTDITLFGRKRLMYGQEMNQNLLSLLEKFACPEDTNFPGTPNLNRSNGKLANPLMGQIWYNTTQKLIFVWNGSKWISLISNNSIASNWGIITHNQQIPQPVNANGEVFSYDQCVWIVGPFSVEGELIEYTIETNQNALVTATSNVGNLVCNYLIIGIKNNTNSGNLTPSNTVTPTPTKSVTPTPSSLPVALSSQLLSFWEFEENGTENVFLDCVGANHFSRFGTIATSLPAGPPFDANHGVVGKAIRAGTTSFFEALPTNGVTSGLGASYSFGGWFQLNQGFISFSNMFQRGTFGIVGQRSFTLSYTLGTDTLTLYKSHDGSAFEFLSVADSGLNDFGWHFIVAWVDGVSLTLNLQVDNGQIFTTPFTFPTTFNIGTFKLGSNIGTPLQMAVDQLFFYNRVINAAERNAIYNGGNGITCSQASGLITPTPTRTVTPTLTPSKTPNIFPLGATYAGAYNVFGDCLRVGAGSCSATTNAASVTVFNGVGPYTYEWFYVSGGNQLNTVINNPNNFSTTFTRTLTATSEEVIVTGNYRCKVTDAVGNVAFTPILVVNTKHQFI